MTRTERLMELVQLLRQHRRPVTAQHLAERLGVSVRTVYRDIETLAGQGAAIQGEAGLGYVLSPGFLLPPLMFADEELEALVLGSRWVAGGADATLAQAADRALAKIAAVLPPDLKDRVGESGLYAFPRKAEADSGVLGQVREAIRRERKLRLAYADASGAATARVVWPFALAFFEGRRVVAAWCELRQDFRRFRTERIVDLTPMEDRYPRRRRALLRDWYDAVDMPAPDRN